MIFNKLFSKSKSNNNTFRMNAENIEISVGESIFSEPSIPKFQGDFAKAVFLWSVDGKPVCEKNGYAKYIMYECGITDPERYHKQMISEGYLEEAPVDIRLKYLSGEKLKEIARNIGVATSGNKSAIIDRIIPAVGPSYINSVCPYIYSLTNLGTSFIEENNDLILLHKHSNSLVTYDEYKQYRTPGQTFYDTMHVILTKYAAQDTKLFGRLQYLELSRIAEEAGHRNKALQFIIQTIYLDFSGVYGLDYYNSYYDGIYKKSALKEQFEINITISAVLDYVSKYKDIYSDEIIRRLYTWELPVRICPIDVFSNIIGICLEGNPDYDEIKNLLRPYYNKYIDSL